jgi:endonuclease YncB( thermonuclease family)
MMLKSQKPRPPRFTQILPICALILASVIFSSFTPRAAAEDLGTIEARVARVVDGDTFKLSGQSQSIRVWGLDAPERNKAGGSAATAALNALISGQTLSCVVVDIDRYQRLVGQCFLPDGRDITAAMIMTGTATEYCRYSKGYYGTC